MGGTPINVPQAPMRDQFIGKEGRNTDKNTGISQPWVLWFRDLIKTLIAQVNAITGATFIDSTQGNLATLAGGLGPANAGQIVYVTDYNHALRWNGTNWTWAPGENGSGYIIGFFNDPSPTTGWQLCDGSATTKLNSDGTVTPVVVPNYTTPSYQKLATVLAAGPTAASGVTGSTSAGTPTGTNSNPTTGNNSANVVVAAGAGTTVAADPHDHPTTAPVFTGAPLAGHDHTPNTIELQRTQLKAWYRR